MLEIYKNINLKNARFLNFSPKLFRAHQQIVWLRCCVDKYINPTQTIKPTQRVGIKQC